MGFPIMSSDDVDQPDVIRLAKFTKTSHKMIDESSSKN